MKSLLCKLPKWLGGGHKRGKRVSETHVSCPRCAGTWARKPQKKVAA